MNVVVVVVVVRVKRCNDDVGRDPHLDATTAACRSSDDCPTDQRSFVVFEDGKGEMCCWPADRYVKMSGKQKSHAIERNTPCNPNNRMSVGSGE